MQVSLSRVAVLWLWAWPAIWTATALASARNNLCAFIIERDKNTQKIAKKEKDKPKQQQQQQQQKTNVADNGHKLNWLKSFN